MFEASESKTIDFVINGAASKCEATVSVPQGWTARVSAMTRAKANTFNGKITVKAPSLDVDSEGELVLEVNMPEAGEMASASLKISSLHIPDQSVVISAQESVTLDAASSIEIPFTVREEITRDLEVKAKSMAEGWLMEVKEFNAVDGGYDGVLKLTAPAVSSNTIISLHVVEKGKEQYLASCSIKAACMAPETSVTLKIATENLTVAPGMTKKVEFTVATLSSMKLSAEVLVNESAWKAGVESFVADGLNYKGVAAITAPSTNCSAIATINIKNDSSEKVATGIINLSASTLTVTFDQPTTNYKASKEYEIGFTTSYTGKLSATAVVTGRAARVKGTSVSLGDDGKSSVGTIKLWTGEYADELTITLKLTDEEKSLSTFNLDLKVSGGRMIPASKTAANCIVVDKAGAVSFLACKGNGTSVKGTKAVLVWKDSDDLFDESSLKYDGANISFSTKSKFAAGNAVVALVDASDNVVWSWHLWFVNGLNLNAPSGSFMNMNLGATSSDKVSESFGLFYQWGRKDPFPGPKDFNSDAEESSSAFSGKNDHPTIMGTGFAWGTTDVDAQFKNYDELAKYPTKMTVTATSLPSSASAASWGPETDPCPLGWRVPDYRELSEHWSCYSENPANTNSAKSEFGFGSSPKNFSSEWWPAPGCRMVSTGGQNWGGALRHTNYSGRYWTSTSSNYLGEYDSDDVIQELGYVNAAHVSWSASYYISLGAWQKNHANSVRCIKE